MISPEVPFETRVHLQALYQKLGNHTQAFSLVSQHIAKLKPGGSTTTILEAVSGGGGPTPGSGTGIPVNNQSGATSYATQSGDDGVLIVLSDASAIAVSLTTQTPPFSCFIANNGALGAGTVTLTPASGTISYPGNPASTTMPVLPTYWALVAFDGSNWFAVTGPIAPLGFNAVTHEFLTAYNAGTGAFSAAQPAFADISGQIASSQLPSSGLSVTITTAKLTTLGSNGSQTFTNGILTASTPAT